jgi:hypothetical protein
LPQIRSVLNDLSTREAPGQEAVNLVDTELEFSVSGLLSH